MATKRDRTVEPFDSHKTNRTAVHSFCIDDDDGRMLNLGDGRRL